VKEEVMRPKNKEIQAAEDAKLRDGLAETFGTLATVRLEGKDVSVRDVVDALDRIAARARATAEAKAQFHRAVAAEKEERAQASALLSAVRATLRATSSTEELLACGLARRKPARALSAEEHAAKAAKLRATREANRTRGVRQVRQERAKAVLAEVYAPNGGGNGPRSPSSPVAAGGGPPEPFG
jgi:hypothetical protein